MILVGPRAARPRVEKRRGRLEKRASLSNSRNADGAVRGPIKVMSSPRGWHSRGYLPHYDGGKVLQFITFHLGDALPLKVLRRWELELAHEKDEVKQIELYRRIEKNLDLGVGECHLRQPKIAEMVQESLIHHNGKRYRLVAWVIMPNHIHFMLEPYEDISLSDIMQGFKSYTAHKANKLLGRSGKFWHEDYFDRYIRDGKHFWNTLRYIEMNPVKAGLCSTAADWLYSSANWTADGSSASGRSVE